VLTHSADAAAAQELAASAAPVSSASAADSLARRDSGVQLSSAAPGGSAAVAGFIGAGLYGGYYGYGYGGCARWRWVATPWGPQWRLVNVCYAPVGYGYGGYPIGYYGGVY
jgi:hypothetical protein